MAFTVLSIIGTRPEAIKLGPVVKAVLSESRLRSRVLLTAQHRELLDQALAPFGIEPDADLDLMRPGQTLAQLTSRVLEGVDRELGCTQPDFVLVQGDTTTAMAATLAAFYRGIPVGHVEAGLRSFDLLNPFPEEANRRLVSAVAALHFAPTRAAVDNLTREQVPASRILLTGNTVVDALQTVAALPNLPPPPDPWVKPAPGLDQRLLVTLHRRESWGAPLVGICRALRRAVDELPCLSVVFPVHPQPRVRDVVGPMLGTHPRISLLEPLDYLAFVSAMKACSFIATDSGGIQEEAPVLGKPVLVLRAVTERTEAVEAGTALLVGVAEQDVYAAIVALATDQQCQTRMSRAGSPFGDGRASERIVDALLRFLAEPGVPLAGAVCPSTDRTGR